MHSSVKWLVGSVALVAVVGCALYLRAHLSLRVALADEVAVALRGALPFKALIDQPIDISIEKELAAKVQLGKLAVELDETLDVPVDFKIEVPIDTDLHVAQPLDLKLDVPIDTVLTERELDLSQLVVPIDTDVFIDDVIDFEATLPLDTEVTTALGLKVPVKARIPIKMKVPIHQKVHVRDMLKLPVHKLRVPLKLVLPLHVRVPFDQDVHVRGTVEAPVKQVLRVPLHKTLSPTLAADTPVLVKLSGQMAASLKTTLEASVSTDHEIPTRLKPLRIAAKDVSLDWR